MKTKQTIVLLILAVALLLLATWYKKHEQSIETEVAAVTKTVIKDLTSGTVERIAITIPDGTTATLTKKDNVWYTDAAKGHKADKHLMGSVFSTVDKEIVGEVVGTNPDTFGDYQVNETSATHVVFYGNASAPIEDLYIGKPGTSRNSTYVRKANTNEVLSVDASLAFMFNKPDGWRDKSIFDIPADTIVGLAGEGTSGTFELKRVVNDWKLVKPEAGPARADKAQSMASVAAALRVTEFVDAGSTQPLAEFGLDPPQQKLTLTREDRSTSPAKPVTEVLLIGKPKQGLSTYYAKRADSDSIYTIGSYQAETLAPKLDDLLPPKPAAAAAPTSATLETAEKPAEAEQKSPPVAAKDQQSSSVAAPSAAAEPKEAVAPTTGTEGVSTKPSDTPATATDTKTSGTL
jgi:hypothetical protein